MRFRKRPVVVEAEQWFPSKPVEGVIEEAREGERNGRTYIFPAWIGTLENWHGVEPGDWIITGVKGERYPCKDDIFRATYEPVEG